MKIPHPALMSLYGTSDVFFKKASAEPRLADVIFEKLALPMATGMRPLSLKPPTQPMRAPSMGIKPPTTAPSAGAAPPPARVQTQMQAPAPGALGAPTGMPAKAAPEVRRAESAALIDSKRKSNPQAAAAYDQVKSAPGKIGAPPAMAPNAPTAKPAAQTTASPAAAAEPAPASKGTPWNKILAVGGALGAGALGLKGLGMGLNFLGGHGAAPPADYGYAPGGYQVPMGVNGYGAPQPGSRMM